MAEGNDDIERYVSGKMTAGERHALERKALSDPFLADALEGSESINGEEFVRDVISLRQELASTKTKKSRVFSLRIAASIAVVLVTSYIIYRVISPGNEPLLANHTPATKPVLPSPAQPKDSLKTPANEKDKLLTYTPPADPTKRKAEKETLVASDKESVQLQTTEKNTGAGALSTGKAYSAKPNQEIVDNEPLLGPTTKDQVVLDKAQLSKTDQPSSVATAISRKSAEQSISGVYHADQKKYDMNRSRTIRGKVISEEDQAPIPGVTITDLETRNGTVSNEKGEYELVTSDQKDSLDFNQIGFKSKSIAVPANESPVDVTLEPEASSLNEVVVMGYDDREKTKESDAAHPVDGKNAFDEYLTKSLRYPVEAIRERKEGTVTVQFSVQTNNQLSDFSIVKGIGQGCDEEAIRLIKEGPAWNPSSSGGVTVKSMVRVKVKFRLPK